MTISKARATIITTAIVTTLQEQSGGVMPTMDMDMSMDPHHPEDKDSIMDMDSIMLWYSLLHQHHRYLDWYSQACHR
jgi:hypothetical protein